MATLSNLMSNPSTELVAEGHELSKLATRISNRLPEQASTASVGITPKHGKRIRSREVSSDAVSTRLYRVEPSMTLSGQCSDVNPLVQIA
jgi:hypothetical protein